MKTYTYLNAVITVDESNTVLSSNTCTKKVGDKIDLRYIKAVGYKELKDGKKSAIRIKE